MGRESVEQKSHRYLCEGRLCVTQLDSLSIEAVCRGGGGGAVYELGHNGAEWWCSCPARGVRCAHLHALRLVSIRAGGVVDDPDLVVGPEPFVTRPASSGAAVDDGDDEDPEPVVSL